MGSCSIFHSYLCFICYYFPQDTLITVHSLKVLHCFTNFLLKCFLILTEKQSQLCVIHGNENEVNSHQKKNKYTIKGGLKYIFYTK